MKFTISWLRQYLDFDDNIDKICQTLTNIGLEVESVEDRSLKYLNFEVAKIISATPHSNSSKLKICMVETSYSKDLIQIICGAKNARPKIKVALAKIGAVIPANQMIIKKTKIAGEESCGMLCSASELQLGEDDSGIIEIDDNFNVGDKISDIYHLNDVIIDINVTPNRGDCLGVYGIARDLFAAGIGKLKNIKNHDITFSHKFPVKFYNNSNNLCSNISLCHIKDINNIKSPQWLKQIIESVGINSISAVIDIINYVMICFNQPMHAYDANMINGDISINLSKKNQNFTTLKNEAIKLDEGSLIICDEEKILSLAGIIGSANSCCSSDTSEIIIEAAFFDPSNISQSGRKYKILSDSRYRFERSIDYQSATKAMNLAISMITEICGGKVSEIISDYNYNYDQKIITFNIDDFKNLIAISINKEQVTKILLDLGFEVNNLADNKISVTVPSWRSDVNIKEDLIEEVIRIYGYDKINEVPFNIDKNISSQINCQHIIKNNLVNNGYFETINWSFVNNEIINDFTNYNNNMEISNPISQDLNYLRPNLVIGLLNSYKTNLVRGFGDLSLFEVGNIFINNPSQQSLAVSGIRVGKNKPDSHYQDSRKFDIFDVKKDLFDILTLYKINPDNLIIDSSNPFKYYHPYRFAAVKMGNKIIGYFGEINPMILKKFSIKSRVNLFEIFIDNLPKLSYIKSKPYNISSFQSSVRDFAFIVDYDQEVGPIINDIYKIDKKNIKNVTLFDIYYGEKLAKNKKSIALSVEIQSLVKTLESSDLDNISNDIIGKITQKYNAIIRNN